MGGPFPVHEAPDCWKEINVHGGDMAGSARSNLPGPSYDAGNPLASFPGGAFSLAQGASASGVVSVAKPGTVVAGEKDHGIPVDSMLPERGEDLSHRPVNFHDNVPIETLLRLALEFFRYVERDVGH